jgi:hypothetical protein
VSSRGDVRRQRRRRSEARGENRTRGVLAGGVTNVYTCRDCRRRLLAFGLRDTELTSALLQHQGCAAVSALRS